MVFNMSLEDPGNVSFSGIGGLSEQIRELREVGPLGFSADSGHRIAIEESRIIHAGRHQATKGSTAIRTTWHRKDTPCKSSRK